MAYNTANGEPEPMGPEGECPATGEPCRELCEATCMYGRLS